MDVEKEPVESKSWSTSRSSAPRFKPNYDFLPPQGDGKEDKQKTQVPLDGSFKARFPTPEIYLMPDNPRWT